MAEKRNVIRRRKENGRIGISTEVYRSGSGSFLVHVPDEKWIEAIRIASSENYSRARIWMCPTISPGYKKEHGCCLFFLPGDQKGNIGNTGKSYYPTQDDRLPWIQTDRSGILGLEMSLDDAREVYESLGRIIQNAEMLSQKEEDSL